MQNHHERHAAIVRHMIEKAMESVDATGGCADSYDRKLTGAHLSSRQRLRGEKGTVPPLGISALYRGARPFQRVGRTAVYHSDQRLSICG